jgi:hypothetical protein
VGRGFKSADCAIAVVLALAAVAIMWAGREITFMADEWRWIFNGLHPSADAILRDDNGHLLASTQVVYDVLLRTVGLGDYWVYRAVALLLQLAVALLVFLLARPRIGQWLAIAPAAVIAFLGTGADAFLSAINIGVLSATLACLAALLMLERGSRRADLAACVLLVVGLASWTSAVAYLAGVFVEVLWRRDRWRRLWVPLIPAGLYLAWKLQWAGSLFGDVNTAGNSPGGVVDVFKHGLQAAAGAVSGLAGVQLNSPTLKSHLPWLGTLTQVAVALGAALLAWFVVRGRRLGARLANLLVTAVVLWLLLALGRGSLGDLYASRYVYVGAVVAALIVVEAASGSRVPSRAARLVAVAAAISVALNFVWMVVWGNHLRDESGVGRSQLAALDIAAGRAPPGLMPSSYALQGVTVRTYLRAVRRFGGSPAYSTAQLRRAPERAREAADEVLVPALGLRLDSSHSSAPEPSSPGVGTARSLVALRALFERLGRLPAQRIVAEGECVALTPNGAPVVADVAPRFGSIVVAGRTGRPLVIQARRFGDHYTAVVGAQRGGTAGLPAPPLGRAPDAWHVRVVSTGPARICVRR